MLDVSYETLVDGGDLVTRGGSGTSDESSAGSPFFFAFLSAYFS